MGARGAFQKQQHAKLRKIGVVPNSFAPFLSILVENGDEKSIQNLMIFLIGFWMHVGRDLGAKMGEKSMPKRCQKHVGIDLEVELVKKIKK